jgi:hypothetical protein
MPNTFALKMLAGYGAVVTTSLGAWYFNRRYAMRVDKDATPAAQNGPKLFLGEVLHEAPSAIKRLPGALGLKPSTPTSGPSEPRAGTDGPWQPCRGHLSPAPAEPPLVVMGEHVEIVPAAAATPRIAPPPMVEGEGVVAHPTIRHVNEQSKESSPMPVPDSLKTKEVVTSFLTISRDVQQDAARVADLERQLESARTVLQDTNARAQRVENAFVDYVQTELSGRAAFSAGDRIILVDAGKVRIITNAVNLGELVPA